MREFAKYSELKVGDKLECDDGFSCIDKGSIVEIKESEYNEKYFKCNRGNHYLIAQKDIKGRLIGLYKVT